MKRDLHTAKVSLTTNGYRCIDSCSLKEKSYYWCWSYHHNMGGQYSYCSPNSSISSYQKPCQDKCSRREKGYFWCNTVDGWDYCSPEYGIDKGVMSYWGNSAHVIMPSIISTLLYLILPVIGI